MPSPQKMTTLLLSPLDNVVVARHNVAAGRASSPSGPVALGR